MITDRSTPKKYIIVIRHGPTHSDESINYNSFIEFITELVTYMKNFFKDKNININEIIPKIISSPYERCVDTSKFITTYLDVLRNNNNKLDIKLNNNLKRWDSKSESRAESVERAITYGNHIFKKVSDEPGHKINIYITHSSIIPGLVSGIVGKKLKKVKLHSACLSIINGNTRELETYNKSFN